MLNSGYIKCSKTTELTFWDWPDPGNSQIQSNAYYTDEPQDLSVTFITIPSDQEKDDTTKVSCSTGNTGDET